MHHCNAHSLESSLQELTGSNSLMVNWDGSVQVASAQGGQQEASAAADAAHKALAQFLAHPMFKQVQAQWFALQQVSQN